MGYRIWDTVVCPAAWVHLAGRGAVAVFAPGLAVAVAVPVAAWVVMAGPWVGPPAVASYIRTRIVYILPYRLP